MDALLHIQVSLTRWLLQYNDFMERRQQPIPPDPLFTEKIVSHSARGFVDLHFWPPTSFKKLGIKHPVVIIVHGGGWSSGTTSMDARFAAALLSMPVQPVVVTVDYSLAPENPFPAGLQDVAAAVSWLAGDGSLRYDLDPTRMVITGFSAGGNLALTTAMWLHDHDEYAENRLPHRLRGIVAIYANVDLRRPRAPAVTWLSGFLYAAWDAAYTSRSPAESPFVSPAAASDELLKQGLPDRIALYTCGEDPLTEACEPFRQRLRDLGKRVTGDIEPGEHHAWDKMPLKDKPEQWQKRERWYARMSKDIEGMLEP